MSKEATKRLVLGFDAGCSTCAEMAQKVKEKVGDKLEVANLRDPQVMEWRKEALGEDAPWAPALFEINGGSVRAWTGKRMGLKLGSALGPVATWRVMQVLGEVGATPEIAEASPMARVGANMSRGQFLKGVGGAAVAMGVLSSTGKLASSAKAAPRVTALEGDRLLRVARRVAGTKDFVNVAGPALRDKVRRGGVIRQCQNGECETIINGGNCSVRQVNGELSVDGDCIVVRAARQVVDGRKLLAVTYVIDNKLIAYYEYDKPNRQGVKNEATLYRVEGDNLRRIESSSNDELVTPLPPPVTPNQDEGFSARQAGPDRCGGCVTVPGDREERFYTTTLCDSYSASCLNSVTAVSCGLCAASCISVKLIPVCLGCVLSTCPPLASDCCTDTYIGCARCAT